MVNFSKIKSSKGVVTVRPITFHPVYVSPKLNFPKLTFRPNYSYLKVSPPPPQKKKFLTILFWNYKIHWNSIILKGTVNVIPSDIPLTEEIPDSQWYLCLITIAEDIVGFLGLKWIYFDNFHMLSWTRNLYFFTFRNAQVNFEENS